jgi:hypothetical protein
VYLIGDEVFWDPPRRRRIRLFDAVTAYNMYDWPRREFAGPAGGEVFLRDVAAQFKSYRAAAAQEGTAFLPAVVPGYNDRGVRLAADHFALSRRLGREGAEGSLFARGLRETGLAMLDPRAPILLVTSFNEWHEWTQVEPTVAAEAAGEPGSPVRYTEGLAHGSYGLRYLELLREAVFQVSGRVVAGPEREPLANHEVHAFRARRRVASVRSDSRGRFRFSPGTLPPGEYLLTTSHGLGASRITVGSAWVGPVELWIPDAELEQAAR